ncbi:MFS transporter [Paramylibacter kogurei]|uniref:MFS transporter n=1 Tax=Paramylibacter kogurei TaxID=1889778 RepID=UPI001F0B4373|nr:MFS transporter [Amylibacter kogurei]
MLTFASCFGQTFFISIFAKDIMAHYTLSNGEWGGIYAMGTMASGFLMIWVGGLTDFFRARTLAVFFLVAISASCLAMAFNNAVWLLPVIIFALRFCGQGMLSHISAVAMSRWFTQNRGKALSIATLGFSAAEATLPILFVALLAITAWQNLWILASFFALLFIPVLLVLLAQERTPQSDAQTNESSVGLRARQWTRPQVLKHWLFWMILPSAMAPPTFGTALFFQQVHLAEVKGWGHVNFVALFPIYTISTICVMLVYGWAVDRWGAAKLLPLYQLPMAAAFFVFGYFDGYIFALIGLLLMALMQGGQSTILAAVWAEYYGTRHLGSIKALAAAFTVFGSAIGPFVTGYFIDAGYSMPQQMPFYAVMIIGACALAHLASKRAFNESV